MNTDDKPRPTGKSVNENVRPICSLCGKIYRGWGHNAFPLSSGRCCDDCNTNKVVPERVDRMRKERRK